MMSKITDGHRSNMNAVADVAKLRRISERFPGRWLRGYVRSKLSSDPVYAAAAAQVVRHPLPVLDIGCGIGLFAHYLRLMGCDMGYHGIDLDEQKISIARHAADGYPDIHFEKASCETLPTWQGHVVILDTLHYLTAALQQKLLRDAATRIAPCGALIIRSVLRDASWRFGITRFEELFMHSVGWMPYGAQHYPDMEELRTPLEEAGLTVQIDPLWGRTPFNSYLVVARRAG